MWCNRCGSDGKRSLRPKSFLPGLLFVFAANLPIIAIRLAELRRWVAPAGPADFWLALEAVITAAVWLYSASRSYAGGLEARRITCSRLLHSSWYSALWDSASLRLLPLRFRSPKRVRYSQLSI